MRRLPPLIAVVWLVVGCCFVGCQNKRSEQANKTAEALRRTIREEITTLTNHAWAGEYYHGDGLGVNVSLILAPKSGYLFEWHGCLGLYDRNHGAVAWDEGKLHLSFTFPNERKGFEGIAEDFFPIAWGDRRYLIPCDDMVEFCNAVNTDSEPREERYGRYLLRRGDEKKEVKGFPEVPPQFKSNLRSHPIEAEIISVGKPVTRPEWKSKETLVTLNSGIKKGLRAGMKLHVIKPEHVVEIVTITMVEDDQAEGFVTQDGEKEAGPQVGWKLSTRCP